MAQHPVTFDDVVQAQTVIQGKVLNTLFEHSVSCSEWIGKSIYLKFENQQKTGSFKMRGAFNKMSQLSKDELKRGVSACSAGNHAQGVALSARLLGAPSYIVMPEIAPTSKVMATQNYGAEVILHGSVFDEAYDYCLKLCKENSYTLVHPYEDADVIAGQGTIALEIFERIKDIDTFIIPIGGGGLIAGMATVIKHLNPKAKIIGVVASRAPGMKLLVESKGQLQDKYVSRSTIADGIAIKKPSKLMYDHYISRLVDEVVEITDSEMAEAMVFLLERAKAVVEGAAGAALAAAKKHSDKLGEKNCVLLCGGNVDLNLIASIIDRGLEKNGRLCRISVLVEDVPGMLNQLTREIASQGANILEVEHKRLGKGIDIRQTRIDILMGTKNTAHIQKIKDGLKTLGFDIQEI